MCTNQSVWERRGMRRTLLLPAAIISMAVATAALHAQTIGSFPPPIPPAGVDSQPPPRFIDIDYGVYFTGGTAFHAPDFHQLDGIPSCCPVDYRSSRSFAFGLGLLYRRSLTRTLLGEVRLGYSGFGTTFQRDEGPVRVAGPIDTGTNIHQPADAFFVHTIESTLGTADLEVRAGYRLVKQLHVYGGLGLSLLIVKQVHSWEHIVGVPGMVFTGYRSQIRNDYDGDIPRPAALLFGATIGVGYPIALGTYEHLVLEPQLMYSPGFSSLIRQNSGSWSVGTLRAGISVRYATLGIPHEPVPTATADEDLPPLHVQ